VPFLSGEVEPATYIVKVSVGGKELVKPVLVEADEIR
jgi:hypothetical protein